MFDLRIGELLIIIVVGIPWSIGIQALGKFLVDVYKLWLWGDLAEEEL